MKLRQMTAAYLFRNDYVLMIKKSGSRFHQEEFWSGLGGHVEPDELNDPLTACRREIYEESGIQASEMEDLKLRYILLRLKEDEIRQQYVYFGTTRKEKLVESEEGQLQWIKQSEIQELHMSAINKFMLEHYMNHNNQSGVLVGTLTVNEQSMPRIEWSELKDPVVF
ncbi:NUDIX domain-containing protein [Paenibacillus sp. XY044]|uniref:NUDIX domain-containing protein n=1 Tax=Paenibacillus sp. XY044 TaxID=2026089 RepID=UPI000B98B6F3|nr:NUDIX domain-containing protein [Paenibacillus sp. XY044]OZB96219.1 hypothetical protein CJP46_09945 [Paenibacillus sp. XY044]